MAFFKHILLMKVRLVIDVEELSLKTPLLKSTSRLNKTNSSRFKELADEGKKIHLRTPKSGLGHLSGNYTERLV